MVFVRPPLALDSIPKREGSMDAAVDLRNRTRTRRDGNNRLPVTVLPV
jgi:hypothetical protein